MWIFEASSAVLLSGHLAFIVLISLSVALRRFHVRLVNSDLRSNCLLDLEQLGVGLQDGRP
jgi:hypothetical protein